MASTSQITVNSVAATAVTVQSTASTCIRIMENRGVGGWPTADFLIYKPTSGATPVRIPAGSSYTFFCHRGLWVTGDIVGYVKMVTGSTTFDQDEDQS